ncbi:MAG: chorismate-binding protein [Heteroscytonema crispum UTEX LB 1556]
MTTNLQPWYWRSLPLKKRTGSDIFATLFRPTTNSGIATLLESPYPTPTNNPQLARYSICAGAPRIVDGQPQMWTPALGEVLPFLEELLNRQRRRAWRQGRRAWATGVGDGHGGRAWRTRRNFSLVSPHPPSPHLPFIGGWLGWLGYDVAWEIENLPCKKSDNLPFPVAFWYEPDCFAVLDHAQQILWLAASHPSQLDELQQKLEKRQPDKGDGCGDNQTRATGVENSFSLPISPQPHYPSGTARANVGTPSPPSFHPPISPSPPLFCTSQQEYETAVNTAKKYIQAGDIFQANLSLRFQTYTSASGWSIYQALQKINPSPFASYWQTPWGEVISCSPERLVQLQSQRQAQTRPIAGTRSRGATPQQDIQLAQDLLNNTKERAEHIMLVDLQRNDLGRVCEWGSVIVDELLTIERYSHVMHLVSNVKGTLRCDESAVDLIRAMFPGGTITGCPKVRCMEIIEELEPVRRSLFYGSCGYLDLRGNVDLNILIRTLLLAPSPSEEGEMGGQTEGGRIFLTPNSSLLTPNSSLKTVWGQVGAGIVADSDPEREWYESLHKAQAQLKALKMLNDQ